MAFKHKPQIKCGLRWKKAERDKSTNICVLSKTNNYKHEQQIYDQRNWMF